MLDQLFTLPQNAPSTSSTQASEKNDVLKVDFDAHTTNLTVSAGQAEITITESISQQTETGNRANKEFLLSLKSSLEGIQKNISHVLSLINTYVGQQSSSIAQLNLDNVSEALTRAVPSPENLSAVSFSNVPHVPVEGSVVEGSFDGQHMIGMNGKQYTIPANYASKSKLVEGDTLKLTITPQGSFIYKQIHPIERRRLLGILEFNPDTREYCVRAESRTWRVLTASITYYKGVPDDEVAIIIPKERVSNWAAVEHIIKNASAF